MIIPGEAWPGEVSESRSPANMFTSVEIHPDASVLEKTASTPRPLKWTTSAAEAPVGWLNAVSTSAKAASSLIIGFMDIIPYITVKKQTALVEMRNVLRKLLIRYTSFSSHATGTP
jgi:hypothetical protein